MSESNGCAVESPPEELARKVDNEISGMPVRLDLGGGKESQRTGFVSIDRKNGGEVYPLKTDAAYPGFSDNSVDEIVASHVLEHLPAAQTIPALAEWFRALKPGGTLRVAVPDMTWIARKILERDGRYPLDGYIYGGQIDENDFHKAAFNLRGLRRQMLMVGFRKIRPWKSDVKDCAALDVSLNLEGTKPKPVEVKNTVAILSRPRFGPLDFFECAEKALWHLNIPLSHGGGPYWHIGMSELMEMTLRRPETKYIISLDYDTLFGKSHVMELYRLMEENPGCDAICAMQIGRDRDSILASKQDANGNRMDKVPVEEIDQDLMSLRTGHFGLTIFRADSLRKLPRPWMIGQVDEEGRWGPKAIHGDVEFWLRWKDAGLTLFQANYVCVGHAQYTATWPGIDLTPVHQSMADFQVNGIPFEARQ